ncbi:arsenate reductase/protein-tyrosine-phosphatase family protein [Nocardiopsis alborubida]|uniref:Helix-turn-helix domain-containing protein n=1 Tax=Nocardiopsis alborubida TaxID=146802 RepID=A0A7X6MBB3_9ACTN|nr:helix-turn-helix domain-containing protein [Nocardiopsis alborubida]NKY96615.1 helix-turn-helix domain-containing protein [Nocardiopsis alborubida]
MNTELPLERRAALHAALADPARLAITDTLCTGDASPSELGERLGMRSNLIAHHLRVLAEADVIIRTRSEADHRRVYIRLLPEALTALAPAALLRAPRVVFVCTHNTARSQLAAALWQHRSPVPAVSAGTRPGPRVHEGAVVAAHRHGLDLKADRTAHVHDVLREDDLVVAVCDSAHEELPRTHTRLHWSVPDPVPTGTEEAFEDAFAQISDRVERLAPAVHPEGTP